MPTVAVAVVTCCLLAACGGSGGNALSSPPVAPAKSFSLTGFQPSAPEGKPPRSESELSRSSAVELLASSGSG